MPLYEYQCTRCQAAFELLIRGDERPVCPECRSRKLEKRLSVPAAHTSASADLPLCNPPGPCGMGSCGLPECGE